LWGGGGGVLGAGENQSFVLARLVQKVEIRAGWKESESKKVFGKGKKVDWGDDG